MDREMLTYYMENDILVEEDMFGFKRYISERSYLSNVKFFNSIKETLMSFSPNVRNEDKVTITIEKKGQNDVQPI